MASNDVEDLTKQLGATNVNIQNELSFKGQGLKLDKREDGMLLYFAVRSKSHCRAVPAVSSPIWCASNLMFIISSKLVYEVKNCNDIMFLC